MDERDKRRVGEQIEPGGRPKAPGRLEMLQRFLNTWNHDLPPDWDRLGTPSKARAWLAEKRLIAPKARITERDAAELRRLREALRRLVLANHGSAPDPVALATVRREWRSAALRIEVDERGATALVAHARGADGAVATLLGILHEARLVGAWPRMKACRKCEYVFFDRSKNRSAAWCAMSICGNRTKNRAYRRRRSGTRAVTAESTP